MEKDEPTRRAYLKMICPNISKVVGLVRFTDRTDCPLSITHIDFLGHKPCLGQTGNYRKERGDIDRFLLPLILPRTTLDNCHNHPPGPHARRKRTYFSQGRLEDHRG